MTHFVAHMLLVWMAVASIALVLLLCHVCYYWYAYALHFPFFRVWGTLLSSCFRDSFWWWPCEEGSFWRGLWAQVGGFFGWRPVGACPVKVLFVLRAPKRERGFPDFWGPGPPMLGVGGSLPKIVALGGFVFLLPGGCSPPPPGPGPGFPSGPPGWGGGGA